MPSAVLIDPTRLEAYVPADHWKVWSRDLMQNTDRMKLQLCEMEPGGGADPHVHGDQDQIFFVVSGTLTVTDGDGNTVRLTGDQALFIAAGVSHATVNDGDQIARYLVITFPDS
jgi:mannose-6-phosphate isomerase-like protein (cupin superfamily)